MGYKWINSFDTLDRDYNETEIEQDLIHLNNELDVLDPQELHDFIYSSGFDASVDEEFTELMCRLSEKHPDKVIIVDEDIYDERDAVRTYYHKGKYQVANMIRTFEPFNPAELEDF